MDSYIESSLRKQREIFKKSLILNPTENISLVANFIGDYEFMSGLYVSDSNRDIANKETLKVSFGGRGRASYDNRKINNKWADALNAESCSLRLLSGLHAHIAVFMSLGKIGETILLLPERAGGHFSSPKILDRLGSVSYTHLTLPTTPYV